MSLLNILFAAIILGVVALLLIIPQKSPILDFVERNLTHTYLLYHNVLTSYALPLGQYGMKLRQKSFSRLLSSFGAAGDSGMVCLRYEVYAGVKKTGVMTKMPVIMEIGAGNGGNFEHYPEECDVTIVEPNEAFRQIIEQKFKDMPKRRLKRFLTCGAESMDVEDDSVDAVISSCLLCSVGDANKVLREVHRVLKPGGKFYFFEHILDQRGTMRRRLPTILNWKYLWPAWFLGCKYCDIAEDIRKTPFSAVNGRKIELDFKGWTPLRIIAPHFIGDATK